MTENNVRRLWTNDELDEALNSLRAEALTDDRPLAAANSALVNAVRSIEGKSTPAPESTPPIEAKGKLASRTGRRWRIGAAAAAAVIAVGATVAIAGADRGGPSPQAPLAAPGVKFLSVKQALNSAADKIHVIGGSPIPAGKFRYVETRTWLLWNDSRIPAAFAGEQLTQTWQPSDFDGQWLLKTAPTGSRKWLVGDEHTLKAGTEKINGGYEADLSEYWPSGEWRAESGKFPGKAMAIAGRCDDEWGAPTEQRLNELPRDPRKLYDLMAADPSVVNKPKLGGVLDLAAQLLKTGTVPADLKESLYRAVAKIPGLKVTEQVANLDGRTGVALGVDPVDGTFRMEIIVDPATGEFIGERRTQLKPDDNDITTAGIKPGTVTFSSSVQTAVVDERGAVPRGR